MALKVNVGASKKVADQNYGSRGASVNLEVELDADLVKEPAKLQEKIRYLFGVARQSLTEELNGSNGSNGHSPTPANDKGNGQAKPPANNNGNGNNGKGGQRRATQSQVKAIYAIARNRRIDIGQFLNDRFHVNKPDDLSIKEASQTIDELKADEGGK
jgi:hypothetical protein